MGGTSTAKAGITHSGRLSRNRLKAVSEAPADHSSERHQGALWRSCSCGKRRWRTSLTSAGVIRLATSNRQSTITSGTANSTSRKGATIARRKPSPAPSIQPSTVWLKPQASRASRTAPTPGVQPNQVSSPRLTAARIRGSKER